MDLINNLKQTYLQGNTVIRLIFINVAIYLVLQIFMVIMKLFTLSGGFIYDWLSLPSDFSILLYKPWTLITYMFLHQDFFHILFNMFALYWFGKLFLIYFSDKQLVAVYVIGGLIAGLLYMVSFNVFPLFTKFDISNVLMGASGSIMSIIIATAVQSPNLEMRFLLLGAVKLKYIAIAVVLISFFGITSNNAGGEIAHLGGALYGYFFVVSLRRGKDFTRSFSKLIDAVFNLFKPKRLKVKKSARASGMTDAEYNKAKAKNMAEVDRILDKIKASGYGSLTPEERSKLFEQGKK